MKHVLRKEMMYLLSVLWQHDKKVFICMIVHIFIGALTPFVGVFIPSVILTLLIRQVEMPLFLIVVGVFLLGYGGLQASLSYLTEYHRLAFVSLRVNYFANQVYRHRSTLDLVHLENHEIRKQLEDAINAIRNNADGVEGMYHDFITFQTSVLGLCIYALSSWGLSIYMTLFLFLLVIIQYVCFTFARKYEFAHREELDGYYIRSTYSNQIAYDISAGKDIRIFQLQDWIHKKFQEVNRLIHLRKVKDYRAYMLVDSIAIALDFLREVGCYAFLIYQLMQGMPIEQFVFYLGIISGFSQWFKKVGESYAQLSKHHVEVGRMMDALAIKGTMHHGTGKKLTSEAVRIVFDHVSFHYPEDETMILQDISFHINEQEKVALVGVNGAGKSTLVKLILGFYLPTSGTITINGIDTREIDVDDLHRHMAGIFQNSKLMSYTIAENVSMRDLQETDLEKVKDCLEQAGLQDFIASLPQQELTYIGKDVAAQGIQLSGGQIQKLFMARTLYEQRGCLLLDEPTAALDALAEKALYEKYHEITKGKSSLFISHRLSSTRFADNILVLDQGKLVEQGTHEQLLKQKGLYQRMFHVQAKYYQKEKKSV